MKKLILISALFMLAFSGYSQFTLQVKLQGDCVYPETTKAAIYGVHLSVYQGTTLITEVTQTMGTLDNIFNLNINEFCVNDNTPVYTIKIEALKAFINPFERICKGSATFGLYSCEDFVNGLYQLVVEME